MQSDVLPLSDFNKQWTPQELDRQAPVYVERVSLRDALQGTTPRSLLNPIELVEPTFQVLPHKLGQQACAVSCSVGRRSAWNARVGRLVSDGWRGAAFSCSSDGCWWSVVRHLPPSLVCRVLGVLTSCLVPVVPLCLSLPACLYVLSPAAQECKRLDLLSGGRTIGGRCQQLRDSWRSSKRAMCAFEMLRQGPPAVV